MSLILYMGMQHVRADLFPSQDLLNTLSTGDIILRTGATLDSMVLSRVTIGPYSHLGLVYRDEGNQILILETFPDKGLQIHHLDEFLKPSIGKTFRVKILKFNGKNPEKLQQVISTIVKYAYNIRFDINFVFDHEIPSIDDFSKKQYDYYCVEMVNMIFQIAYGADFLKWPNDYEKVEKHLRDQMEFYKQNAKIYFDHTELRMIHFMNTVFNLQDKILLTPTGILNSSYFDSVFEGEDLSLLPEKLKVFLT